MAGTRAGGLKAKEKNLAKNPNFYREIGRKGGQNGTTGGFYNNPELAKMAGTRGGTISRRSEHLAPVPLEVRRKMFDAEFPTWDAFKEDYKNKNK